MTMRNKLREIINDMSYNAFTIDTKTDYLLEHDVVPIVRCKDCKYADVVAGRVWCGNGDVPFVDLDGLDIEMKPDDFCSYGESKG